MSLFCLENGPLFISQNHWANTYIPRLFFLCLPAKCFVVRAGTWAICHPLLIPRKLKTPAEVCFGSQFSPLGIEHCCFLIIYGITFLMKYVYSKNPQSAYKSIVSCFCFHSYLKLHLTLYLRSQHCVPYLSHWIPELLLFMRRVSGQLAAARLTSTPYKQT